MNNFQMMKLFLLLLILIQCNVSLFGQQSYSITGNIMGVQNGTRVYLSKYRSDQIDSTIVADGQFIFKGHVEEPVEAAIVFSSLGDIVKSEKRKIFWLENSEIKIKGNISSLPTALVSGSVSHKDYVSYIDELYTIGKVSDSYSDLDKTFLTEKYIVSHPDAYKSAQELYLYRQIIPFAKVKSFYSAFTDRIKTSSFGVLLLNFINHYRMLKVGDCAPDFTLTTINNKSVKLSSFKGKCTSPQKSDFSRRSA